MNIKDKIFLKNFLMFLSTVILFSFLLGVRESEAGGVYFNFAGGYNIVSFLCVLWLGTKVAIGFVKSEHINELRAKENMTNKEFNEKYGEIMDIYEKN